MEATNDDPSRPLYVDESPLADVAVSLGGVLSFTRRQPGRSEVLVWNTRTSPKPVPWLAETLPVRSLFGFDGRRVFAHTGTEILLIEDGRAVSLHRSVGEILSPAASPDGEKLVWIEPGEPAVLWRSDRSTGARVALEVRGTCVRCCFSSSNEVIAVCLDEGGADGDPEGNRAVLGSSVWLSREDVQPQLVASFPGAAILDVVPHPVRPQVVLSVSSEKRGTDHDLEGAVSSRFPIAGTVSSGVWAAEIGGDGKVVRLAEESARAGGLRWFGQDEVVFSAVSCRYPASVLMVAGSAGLHALRVAQFIDQLAVDETSGAVVYRVLRAGHSEVRALSVESIRQGQHLGQV